MEPVDSAEEAIPLYSPRKEEPPPPIAAAPLMTGILASASQRVASLCGAGDEWEIMENNNGGALLCFAFRDEPHRYRVAGHLEANAALLIVNLKECPKGAILLETEHVKTFGENVDRLRHSIRLPGPWSNPIVMEGLQQCVFMEDSQRFLYIFVTEESSPISFLLGAWIRELDEDAGCEVEVVFEWSHRSPGLRTWASDILLENVWLTAENLVVWARLFSQQPKK